MSHQDNEKNKRLHETIESLAHPDEQARELADKFLGDWIGSYDPDESKWIMCRGALRDLLLEVRLAEVEWWYDYHWGKSQSGKLGIDRLNEVDERLRSLRQAVGERK